MKRIAFAGTDGRTLLWAYTVATATSDQYPNQYHGTVIRGTPAMPVYAEQGKWPVTFVPTASNRVTDYTNAILQALRENALDVVVPMPEALLFEGLTDAVVEAGFGDRIIGLDGKAAFIEGDKIACKKLCQEAGIPVAPAWTTVNARDYSALLTICLEYLQAFGGVVLKYPYSAGGKGARIIRNSWEIKDVYTTLINDYRDSYRQAFGKKGNWPLLIEALMSGMEISFTILVDARGHYQILPTAMDYPERFEGPAGANNPITGGTGAISPHPMETPELIAMAGRLIAEPLVDIMAERNLLRPSILYPGCFVSLDQHGKPTGIRVCEINIRPGEPEAQPVARRLRNLGVLLEATLAGNLDQVLPEVRKDQLSVCFALMTGPGGPDGQRGYPWSCTKGEPVIIDTQYMRRKSIQVIPSAMTWIPEETTYKSDGTRVAFISGNITLKPNETRSVVAERLRNRLLSAFDNGKIRVVPRENPAGNRLDLRRDIGTHYLKAEQIFAAN